MIDTPYAADERQMLLAFLQRQRSLVAWKINGLTEADAGAVATDSGLTIRGVVSHLTDVERSWVRRWFAGIKGLPVAGPDENWVGGFDSPAGVSLADLLSAYADESRLCDEIVASHSLDDLARKAPRTLRWILHHLVEETSRHLGHLDLLCELADGRTGEGPA